MIRVRTRPSAPRSSATRTAIAHRASCQPRKNHGDPRQAVTPPASLWSVKKANGANSRSTATGAESGCDRDRTVTRLTQPERTRNSTNAAPGNRTQRPSATPSSGPPSDGTTICPTRTAIRADGLNAPYAGSLTGWKCRNASRARQPQPNGTIATAHRAAVRAGRVTGVTPTTGSLARIDRVSQNAASMPNPPRKIAAIRVHAVDLGDRGAPAGPESRTR